MPQIVKFGVEAREAMLKGAKVIADAVGSTLGPKGSNVSIGREYGPPWTIHDGVNTAKSISLVDPFEDIGASLLKEAASKTNDAAGDGPQPLYAKVLTPTGFVPMGDLKVGDRICGAQGTIQAVTGVFPKGIREVIEIHLFDGSVVECCEDHLWSVTTNYGNKKVLPVKKLRENFVAFTAEGHANRRYYVPVSAAELTDKDIPLDPYLVGTLIGDGSLSGSGAIELSIGTKKANILEKIQFPEGIAVTTTFVEERNYYRAKIHGITPEGKSIETLLGELGLLGTKSDTKFIPESYLFSSIDSRKKLLQGLLDTDGYINNRGLFEYSTVSRQLSQDIMQLIRSLGILARLRVLDRKPNFSYSNRSIYRIAQMKGGRFGNAIVDIIATGEDTEMQCISVSNEDNLYVTDDCVLTHNTTTSTVLGYGIAAEAHKNVIAGSSPMMLRKGIEKAERAMQAELATLATPITTPEEILQVATISAQNDEIGAVVADGINRMGKDGVLAVEESGGTETYLEVKEGMEFSKGWMSPYFITNPELRESVLDAPYILVTDMKFSSVSDITPFLKKFVETPTDTNNLLIIADEIVGDALALLIINKGKGALNVCAVQAPSFAEHRRDMLQDIATVTGAHFFSTESGAKLTEDTFGLEHLGRASRVTATEKATIIVDGAGEKEDILTRIAELKNSEEKAETDFIKEKLQERIARLTTGVGIVYVGASSETEMRERKERFIDAISATKAAMDEGIVPGGETALIRAALVVDPTTETGDIRIGMELVKRAAERPFRKLMSNAGYDEGRMLSALEAVLPKKNWGVDVIDGTAKDMVKSGIIDPVKVTKQALANAASVASMILSTDTIVVDEPKKENRE